MVERQVKNPVTTVKVSLKTMFFLPKASGVWCPDGQMCPDGETCCQMSDGSYGCCCFSDVSCKFFFSPEQFL